MLPVQRDTTGQIGEKNAPNDGTNLTASHVIKRSESASTDNPEMSPALDETCAGIDEMAQSVAAPADIIVALDSTSSITAETKFVQSKLNSFAQRIVDAKVDVRLILICEKPGPYAGNPICIPPPLAGASCGDNEPRFKHIDQLIGYHDAWEQIVAMYPQYKRLLRPDAQKHIVVITDDSAGPSKVDSSLSVNDERLAVSVANVTARIGAMTVDDQPQHFISHRGSAGLPFPGLLDGCTRRYKGSRISRRDSLAGRWSLVGSVTARRLWCPPAKGDSCDVSGGRIEHTVKADHDREHIDLA